MLLQHRGGSQKSDSIPLHFVETKHTARWGNDGVYSVSKACATFSVHFSSFLFSSHSSVSVCLHASLLAGLTLQLHSHSTYVAENNGECACKRAGVYASVMQNSLAFHPTLELKKSRSQEATLKYQVLIWQIQATGVFTFQRLREEKVQMPPWAVSI